MGTFYLAYYTEPIIGAGTKPEGDIMVAISVPEPHFRYIYLLPIWFGERDEGVAGHGWIRLDWFLQNSGIPLFVDCYYLNVYIVHV